MDTLYNRQTGIILHLQEKLLNEELQFLLA